MASLLSNQNAFRRLTERAADIGGGSYLFWGPKGLGKMEAAAEFAKSLECLKKTPCLNCRSCVDIDKRIHPDVLIVEPKIGERGEEIFFENFGRAERARYSDFGCRQSRPAVGNNSFPSFPGKIQDLATGRDLSAVERKRR